MTKGRCIIIFHTEAKMGGTLSEVKLKNAKFDISLERGFYQNQLSANFNHIRNQHFGYFQNDQAKYSGVIIQKLVFSPSKTKNSTKKILSAI
ncbi:MAG: hypothetical protein LAT68_04180 [Cyclobacteriaceae bacterium]|nr:hypothetical protein [Cyclobacteriaceae bacterium]MCH8515507.1 hypothetical protein [Cyclobacteriaceae bacterium]